MDEVWIPIIGMLCVFGLPVGAFIVFRILAHRERMEMIRHGLVPPGKGGPRYASAQRPYVGGEPLEAPQPDAGVLLRKGIRLAFTGMALTIGLSFIGYHSGDDVTRVGNVVIHDGEHFNFGPWLLGGLIPLFIGLSQIAIAFLTDPSLFARYRRPASGGPYGAGPGPGPVYPDPPAPGPANSDGPYTYRPGGRQELRPPTTPPTRRP
jgi:hypothetical protein